MKIVESIATVFSHQMRSFWNLIQDMICLVTCVIASSVSFPYYARANRLFIFFTGITICIFLYKAFKTENYKEMVKVFGAWGSRYRCFYAIYYPVIAFLCASWGGFKGYSFAIIWMLAGGSYIVIADQIFREESVKKKEVADEIEKEYTSVESGCPYCKSDKYKDTKTKDCNNQLKITHECSNKACKKQWTVVYTKTDLELNREDIPANLDVAMRVFS